MGKTVKRCVKSCRKYRSKNHRKTRGKIHRKTRGKVHRKTRGKGKTRGRGRPTGESSATEWTEIAYYHFSMNMEY